MTTVNECIPITIFPMGVFCQTTNPTTPNGDNGTATLIISGGTPPYTITWENGNSTSTITNLSEGSYPAVVVDYYGDFTAYTTCVLVSPTTTTTTLPTTPMCFATSTECVGDGFCGSFCTTPITGYYNGKPYYRLFSDDCVTPLNLYVWWNSGATPTQRWEFTSVLGGGDLYEYNENPSNFPESNEEYPWVIVEPTIIISSSTLGECEPLYDFCMELKYINPKYAEAVGLTQSGTMYGSPPPNQYGVVSESIHFNPTPNQSWISDDYSVTITWDNINNYWVVNGIDVTVINTNPSYPPLTGWQVLGVDGSVTVNEGECQNVNNLSLVATLNLKGCDYTCQNSIVLEGSGGVPPYQFSINGGATWSTSPIFQNLCNGLYSPQIKDSNGTVYEGDSITIIGGQC